MAGEWAEKVRLTVCSVRQHGGVMMKGTSCQGATVLALVVTTVLALVVTMAFAGTVGAQDPREIDAAVMERLEAGVSALLGDDLDGDWVRDFLIENRGTAFWSCVNAGGQRDAVYLAGAARKVNDPTGMGWGPGQPSRVECERFSWTRSRRYTGLYEFLMDSVSVRSGQVRVPSYSGELVHSRHVIRMAWADDHYYRVVREDAGDWMLWRQRGYRGGMPPGFSPADRPSAFILDGARESIQRAVTRDCELRLSRPSNGAELLAGSGLPTEEQVRLLPVVEDILARVSVLDACEPGSNVLWDEFERELGPVR